MDPVILVNYLLIMVYILHIVNAMPGESGLSFGLFCLFLQAMNYAELRFQTEHQLTFWPRSLSLSWLACSAMHMCFQGLQRFRHSENTEFKAPGI